MRVLLALVLAGLTGLAGAPSAVVAAEQMVVAQASLVSPFGTRPDGERIDPLYEGNPFKSFPACDAPSVLNKIQSRFRYAENRTWKRGFVIDQISRVKTVRTKPDGRPEVHARRYCRGTAYFSNGRRGSLHYLIEEGAGIVGFGFNVDYCIDGLDPWRVSDGFCRTVRPF